MNRVFGQLRENVSWRGVQDWKSDETRTWADRAFPGEGKVPMAAIINRLDAAGFTGSYDVEIFSDAGHFDYDYPDSLWKLPPAEIVDRATRIFAVPPLTMGVPSPPPHRSFHLAVGTTKRDDVVATIEDSARAPELRRSFESA
jgi:hypothetical protein